MWVISLQRHDLDAHESIGFSTQTDGPTRYLSRRNDEKIDELQTGRRERNCLIRMHCKQHAGCRQAVPLLCSLLPRQLVSTEGDL